MNTTLSQHYTPSEVEITTAPTVELVDRLQTGQLTAEATVTAFCKRAALAHQALDCATDIFFDEAIQTAKEYDRCRESTGKTKGPLHGLPVSIKDAFDIAGHITTSGLVSRLDNVAREDTLLVAILREAGAIPFVKTNISQGCLLVESTNNIYGTVLNPWNRNLSAGGSSGGEGALVAFRGSPLGVGTDGGGSLRIPAAWNGIYTLKPTAARIPGFPGGAGRSTSNSANNGPLAWDLDTVELFCDVVLSYKPWLKSPSVMPLPWVRGVKAPARLKLGFLFDDGIVHFSPPVTRCLREAAKLLGDAGHEIVELGPDWADLHRRAAGVAFTMYTEEGGIGLREELEKSGEPLVPRVCTGWSEQPLTPSEIWANHRRRNALATEYLRKFQLEGLDAIVTAPMPHPAPPHGEYITSAICAAYNALDVPVCCVPFGRVDLQKDIAPAEWYDLTPYDDMPNFPYDRYDRDMMRLCMCFSIRLQVQVDPDSHRKPA
ncbi:uncharacterized protein E0L32_007563 [Thyridium curvatum]|uniref:amidase n=1 Tax=Thyridium curvatum TaxID=1093900 RepID=A0A507AYH4_9PEZI|nr:uncharacterized protein E0L32_007563 [Thyridium curvatum]TPX11826.1 hypothetical protein E0L32_007563 [Thyridium curvatum]